MNKKCEELLLEDEEIPKKVLEFTKLAVQNKIEWDEAIALGIMRAYDHLMKDIQPKKERGTEDQQASKTGTEATSKVEQPATAKEHSTLPTPRPEAEEEGTMAVKKAKTAKTSCCTIF